MLLGFSVACSTVSTNHFSHEIYGMAADGQGQKEFNVAMNACEQSYIQESSDSLRAGVIDLTVNDNSLMVMAAGENPPSNIFNNDNTENPMAERDDYIKACLMSRGWSIRA